MDVGCVVGGGVVQLVIFVEVYDNVIIYEKVVFVIYQIIVVFVDWQGVYYIGVEYIKEFVCVWFFD